MNLPPYLLQSPPETDACEAFSLCNYIFLKTGWLPSMVDLARIADLEEPANEYSDHVLAMANSGLTSYSNCPLPNPLTLSAFYSYPTNVPRIKLGLTLVSNPKDPYLWTQLQWGSNLPKPTNHMVVMINNGSGDFIDSEPGGQIKNINRPSILGGPPAKIIWQSSLSINFMNATQVVLSKDGKTVYLCTPIAMDWANFLKQASVEGIIVPDQIPPSSSL